MEGYKGSTKETVSKSQLHKHHKHTTERQRERHPVKDYLIQNQQMDWGLREPPSLEVMGEGGLGGPIGLCGIHIGEFIIL